MSEQISKGSCARVGKPCLTVWGVIYLVTAFLSQWRKFYLICCNSENLVPKGLDHVIAKILMMYSYKEKKLKNRICFKDFLPCFKSWKIPHTCHFVLFMLVTHIHIHTIYKLHTDTHTSFWYFKREKVVIGGQFVNHVGVE